ncbi:hypothetical protein [Reyranella sp.]|uniref:hypothetical protein n=1 Tax=Reyranella sp. TaxID=1929291 RepID=UPI003BA9F055
MTNEFDPVGERAFWFRYNLEQTINNEFSGPSIAPSRAMYAPMQAGSLVSGYLLGLSKELHSTVERLIAWMESEPEPTRADYEGKGYFEDDWRATLYKWRQVLGVCKWLARGERAHVDLTASIAADWQGLRMADPKDETGLLESRRSVMGQHLAVALAADAPLFGLEVFEATQMKMPMELHSRIRFGHWACRHLVDGGTRDQTFVSRGRQMLKQNLLSLYEGGDTLELALWLKAIYFDSGVADTPEATFARAYDSMPGIDRPDFIAP